MPECGNSYTTVPWLCMHASTCKGFNGVISQFLSSAKSNGTSSEICLDSKMILMSGPGVLSEYCSRTS